MTTEQTKVVTLTDKQLDFIVAKLVEEINRYEERHRQHADFVSSILNACLDSEGQS